MIQFICSTAPIDMIDWIYKCDSHIHFEPGKQETHELKSANGLVYQMVGKQTPTTVMFEDHNVALLFQIKYNEYIIATDCIEDRSVEWRELLGQ